MILRKLAAATIASTVLASGALAQDPVDTTTSTTTVTMDVAARGQVFSTANVVTLTDVDSDGIYIGDINFCAERNSATLGLEITSDGLKNADNSVTLPVGVTGSSLVDAATDATFMTIGACSEAAGSSNPTELSVDAGSANAETFSGTVVFNIVTV